MTSKGNLGNDWALTTATWFPFHSYHVLGEFNSSKRIGATSSSVSPIGRPYRSTEKNGSEDFSRLSVDYGLRGFKKGIRNGQ